MGETSARGLRGDEMDHVIFAGTAARPPFDLAEVELHLRGTARPSRSWATATSFSCRGASAAARGSTFRVNGKEVRARDVQLLFADAASGARSAAIVSQGRIGALVDAKPPDRRRLLEEAAGIGGLQARRHEAELKLQAAEANLLRVQDLLVTLGEQHRQLRKQARQASRYRELSAAYREVEAALLACRWRLACRELAAAEQLLRDERSQIELCSERLRGARAARDQAAAEVERLRQHDAPLAAELARLDERRRAVGDEADRLEAHRTRLRETDEQLERDLRDGQSALEEAQAARSRLEVERSGLADVEMAAHLRCEQAAAAETASTQTLDAAEAELRQALARAGRTRSQARTPEGTPRQVRTGPPGPGRRATGSRTGARHSRRIGIARGGSGAPDRGCGGARGGGGSACCGSGPGRCRPRSRGHPGRAGTARQRSWANTWTACARPRRRQRQASQRREALQARHQEIEQRRARLSARLRELTAALDDRTQRRGELELTDAGGGVRAGGARARHVESRSSPRRAPASAEAEAAVAEAQPAEQSARSRWHQLEAEIKALAELAGPERHDSPVIDLVEIGDGAADALAAALGDDLLGSLDDAAPAHWLEAPAAAEAHALPPGCRALADLVKAPAALRRRLRQVGVVDAEAADRLQPQLRQGQRLVSPDGGLWRWDGFVRRPDSGRAAAARLQQRARLRDLRRDSATAQDHLVEAERDLATAKRAAEAARGAQRAAESACEAARRELETCRSAALETRADNAALAAEITALAQERAVIDAEHGDLERTAAALLAQLDDLGEVTPPADIAGLQRRCARPRSGADRSPAGIAKRKRLRTRRRPP